MATALYFISLLSISNLRMKILSQVYQSRLGYLLAFVWLLAICGMAVLPSQSDFYLYLPFLCTAFTCYALLVSKDILSLKAGIAFAILARIIMVFIFPNLSDDVYRFIWDGYLCLQGINPYSMLPSELITLGHPELSSELYELLNSPDYYSVYPPLAQLIFSFGALADDWYWSSVLMKIPLLLAEIATICLIIKLLKNLTLSASKVLLYALNPLIVVELMCNMHFEGIMICLLLFCLYNVLNGQMIKAGIFLCLSIATKLLPLLFAPLIWKYSKHNLKLFFSCLILSIVTFSPVLFGIEITNFLSSIDLYFGKFEFNGGIYYILRYIGQVLSGYNLIRYIGPLMGIFTILYIFRSYKKQNTSFELLIYFMFSVFTLYILLTTTLHPWYLALPIMLSCFLPFRFILVWSFLISLTYINYSYPVYRENFWIVGLEYGIVLSILWYEYQKYCLKYKQLYN